VSLLKKSMPLSASWLKVMADVLLLVPPASLQRAALVTVVPRGTRRSQPAEMRGVISQMLAMRLVATRKDPPAESHATLRTRVIASDSLR
jgi:hypothetical protein